MEIESLSLLFAFPFSFDLIVVAFQVGMVQNILSKAIKYALFDPTKEMAYIPLDAETKIKGKAAIDVLAARVGKSGGALVQQLIVMIFGNIIKGAGCVATVFFGESYPALR